MAAKRYFEAAISNLPRNLEPEIKLQAAECYHQLSQIQLELGDPREASDDSDKANGLVPNSPAYITGKASVMLQMKDYKNEEETALANPIGLCNRPILFPKDDQLPPIPSFPSILTSFR